MSKLIIPNQKQWSKLRALGIIPVVPGTEDTIVLMHPDLATAALSDDLPIFETGRNFWTGDPDVQLFVVDSSDHYFLTIARENKE